MQLANEYAAKSSSPSGYWSCVGKCLKGAWDTLPNTVRIACEGSCFSCATSANPILYATCVGCLGGYALKCITYCY